MRASRQCNHRRPQCLMQPDSAQLPISSSGRCAEQTDIAPRLPTTPTTATHISVLTSVISPAYLQCSDRALVCPWWDTARLLRAFEKHSSILASQDHAHAGCRRVPLSQSAKFDGRGTARIPIHTVHSMCFSPPVRQCPRHHSRSLATSPCQTCLRRPLPPPLRAAPEPPSLPQAPDFP